jgi:hypothetical protein
MKIDEARPRAKPLTAKMATAFIKGVQSAGAAATEVLR